MKKKSIIRKLLLVAVLFTAFYGPVCKAADSEFVPQKPGNNLVFGIGFGYGLANNPVVSAGVEKHLISGAVVGATLGYKISNRFKIDFGPSVWVESKDLFDNTQGNNNRPSNKRLMIALNGYYYPIKNNSFNIKAGIGIGNILFTPENATVRMDNTTYENSEIGSGVAMNVSLIYGVKVCDNIKIHPSLNFTYNQFKTESSSHFSYLNDSTPSITTDLRINFYFSF